jgi:hypothetical protein
MGRIGADLRDIAELHRCIGSNSRIADFPADGR